MWQPPGCSRPPTNRADYSAVLFTKAHGRVLAPGGPVVVSFSNRCFPTKAVALWLAADDDDHRLVVREYLERSGFVDVSDEIVKTPDDPLFVVSGRAGDLGAA